MSAHLLALAASWALASGSLPIPPAAPTPSPVTVVTGLRWAHDKLSIEATGPLATDLMTLHHPERIVVDLLNSELADPTLSLPLSIHQGAIRDVRIGAHPETNSVRFVLDCRSRVPFSLYTRTDTHRIVLVPDPVALQLAQRPPSVVAPPPAIPPPPLPRLPALPPPAASTPLPPLPAPSPSLGAVADLARVQWLSNAGGGTLRIDGNGKIAYQLREQLDPTRVTVTLFHTRLAGSLPVPDDAATLSAQVQGPDTLLDLTLPARGRLPASGLYALGQHLSANGQQLTLQAKVMKIHPGDPLVVIDPGHGGSDPGAIGPAGTHEADRTLELARRLKAILWRRYRIPSVLTRTCDTEMDLEPRVQMIDLAGASLLVSLHCNAYTNPTSDGIETYFRNPGSLTFAQTVHQTLIGEVHRVDRGVKQARLFVLRHHGIPSILVESGFITNPTEEKLLGEAKYQRAVAIAIADGIHRYATTMQLGSRKDQPLEAEKP